MTTANVLLVIIRKMHTPNMSSLLCFFAKAHSWPKPCSNETLIAISPQVISAPYSLQIRLTNIQKFYNYWIFYLKLFLIQYLNGKLPTVVNGLNNNLSRHWIFFFSDVRNLIKSSSETVPLVLTSFSLETFLSDSLSFCFEFFTLFSICWTIASTFLKS